MQVMSVQSTFARLQRLAERLRARESRGAGAHRALQANPAKAGDTTGGGGEQMIGVVFGAFVRAIHTTAQANSLARVHARTCDKCQCHGCAPKIAEPPWESERMITKQGSADSTVCDDRKRANSTRAGIGSGSSGGALGR